MSRKKKKDKKFVPRRFFNEIEFVVKVNKQKVLQDVVRPDDVESALERIRQKLL